MTAPGHPRSITNVSRISAWCLVFSLYVLGAASSFSGYFAKWAFQDGNARASYVDILSQRASRPFVYRQLIPLLSRTIAGAIPEGRRDEMLANRRANPTISSIYSRATDADVGPFSIEYHIAYLLCFGFWLAALLMLARICWDTTKDMFASLAAPLIFAQIYPILMTRGGFFYDPVEMFFLAASLWFAIRGRLVALLLLTPIATLNKESFLFWLPCLWTLFPASLSGVKRAGGLAVVMLISGLTYLSIKAHFANNPGGAVEFHLVENLGFYSNPRSYFRREFTYGIALPAGVALINLALLAAIVNLGWTSFPERWRKHMWISLIINIPLFLALCWLDELRNLSLLFVWFTVLIACAIHRGMPGSAGHPLGALPKPAL